jgi:hypothetical protein
MKTGDTRAMKAAIAMAACLLAGGCGDDSADRANSAQADEASFETMALCGEARGSLLELNQMMSGQARVDTSSLDHGETMFRRLATHVSAPAEVVKDVDQWHAALGTWSDRRTAMPPNFTGGRLIEPDTTGIDQALMSDLRPIRDRLTTWHGTVCKS